MKRSTYLFTILILTATTTYSQSTIETLFKNMVLVEGGTYMMGCTKEQGGDCDEDEKPAHKVTVKSFYISKFEVTQAQYVAIMGDNPSLYKDCPECPVDQIVPYLYQDFLIKLNAKTKKKYRFPTEAEWEYAARGGKLSKGTKFSGSNDLNQVGWTTENSGDRTHEVGQKLPNELGLYDMSGNAREWCSDYYSEEYYKTSPADNPKGPAELYVPVVRDGSTDYPAKFSRVSNRNSYAATLLINYYGMRLVLDK